MQPISHVSHWANIRLGLRETVSRFNDDDLDFAPYPDAWSVGEIMLHIANVEEGWFRYVVTQEMPRWPDYHTREYYPTHAAVLEVLDRVHECTEAYLADLTPDDLEWIVTTPWGVPMTQGEIIWHVVEHEIHHRGELSLVLGMLGRPRLEV